MYAVNVYNQVCKDIAIDIRYRQCNRNGLFCVCVCVLVWKCDLLMCYISINHSFTRLKYTWVWLPLLCNQTSSGGQWVRAMTFNLLKACDLLDPHEYVGSSGIVLHLFNSLYAHSGFALPLLVNLVQFILDFELMFKPV